MINSFEVAALTLRGACYIMLEEYLIIRKEVEHHSSEERDKNNLILIHFNFYH
jgi:hypothetical protein